CLGDGPGQVFVDIGGQRTLARKARAQNVAETATFTLYRLETPTSREVPTPIVAEQSQSVSASAAGLEWRGFGKARGPKEIVVEPDLTVSPGTPVLLAGAAQASVVGVTVPMASKTGILPISTVLNSFPELK